MEMRLAELARAVGAQLVGDGDRVVRAVSSAESATPDDLVFAEDAGTLAQVLTGGAGAIAAGPFAAETSSDKPLLLTNSPRLAFARAARLLHPAVRPAAGIHPSALVDPSALLGGEVHVGAHAVIGGGAGIGDRTSIGPGAVIGERVRIGSDCEIKANVVIYPGTHLGTRVIVHAGAVLGSDGFGYVRDETSGTYEKFPQVGVLEIGDDVEIGANTTIDRGALGETIIESGTKLDNLVHIAHNVRVGRNVVIAAQCGVAGSSVIESDVVMGGQVGVADHVRIEAGVLVGAQTGIPSRKVLRGRGVVYWGTAARPIQEVVRELAMLRRLARGRRSDSGQS
jgi:UDP-3-O-[3-hydroxymyristoyl] glucosamine N-acyltransferase